MSTEAMRAALAELLGAAKECSRMGAQTGKQWGKLTVACLHAEAALAQRADEPVAWRWSESNGERWFSWTTDWEYHTRALTLGVLIEYAYPAAAPAAPAYVPLSDASEEDLYWRLHGLSKRMESSGRIDEHEYPSAYATILDAMKAVRQQAQPCIGGDPSCPCQDGDACHYKDTPTTKAWPVPQEAQPAAPPCGQICDGVPCPTPRRGNERLCPDCNPRPITDATYLGLAEDIARLTAEGEALKRFAMAMLEHWPLGDVDGGDLQEEAVKHGLLVPETRTAVCSEEGCNCAEYYSAEEWGEGITCYRKAAWLKGMAT